MCFAGGDSVTALSRSLTIDVDVGHTSKISVIYRSYLILVTDIILLLFRCLGLDVHWIT